MARYLCSTFICESWQTPILASSRRGAQDRARLTSGIPLNLPHQKAHRRNIVRTYLFCRGVIVDSRRRASIESLTRLHQKSKAIDTYLDDHVEINSTRRAWDEVRDNVERGIHLIQSCITFLMFVFSRNTSTGSLFKYSLGGCPEPVDQYESE